MNPKLRRGVSKDGEYIMGRLLILQNRLLGDNGELSPGDYDLLIKKAREIYAKIGAMDRIAVSDSHIARARQKLAEQGK